MADRAYVLAGFSGDVTPLPLVPPMWELHLSATPQFTAGPWSKSVRAAGGRYSEARGYQSCRFVDVPSDASALIDELARRFAPGRFVAVARGVPHELPSWAVVIELKDVGACASPSAELARAWRRSLQVMARDPRISVIEWDRQAQERFEVQRRAREQAAFASKVSDAVVVLVGLVLQVPAPGTAARAVAAAVRRGVAAARKPGADAVQAARDAGERAGEAVLEQLGLRA